MPISAARRRSAATATHSGTDDDGKLRPPRGSRHRRRLERNATEWAGAVETERGWRFAALEASYDQFLARAKGAAPDETKPGGSRPNAAELLAAAQTVCGRRVDLIAIDMPMSRRPIIGRRAADRLVSERYGAKDAATHSPGKDRPGKISDKLRTEFEAEGYALCTAPPAQGLIQGLIEVYPHPALIEFLKAERRLEYKAGTTGVYWPALSLDERHLNLRAVWARIVLAHWRRRGGAAAAGPRSARLAPQGL